MNPTDLQPLLPVLQAVVDLLEAAGCRGMIIGGVAVSLTGKPRFTADVDAVVLIGDERLEAFLEQAGRLGLEPRVAGAIAFARSRRVLLLKHAKTGIGVDLSLGLLPFEEEAVQRARTVVVGPLRMRIPTVEDLIVFKAVAHRPKDLEDIRGLVALHPDLDVARVETWVRDFGQALEMPELWEDVKPLFGRHRGDPPG